MPSTFAVQQPAVIPLSLNGGAGDCFSGMDAAGDLSVNASHAGETNSPAFFVFSRPARSATLDSDLAARDALFALWDGQEIDVATYPAEPTTGKNSNFAAPAKVDDNVAIDWLVA